MKDYLKPEITIINIEIIDVINTSNLLTFDPYNGKEDVESFSSLFN